MTTKATAIERRVEPTSAGLVAGLVLILTLVAVARPLAAGEGSEPAASPWGDRGGQPAALTELALLEARRLEARDPGAASAGYLRSAARAYAYLFGPASACKSLFEAPCDRVAALYRRATSGYLAGRLRGARDFQQILDAASDVAGRASGATDVAGRASGATDVRIEAGAELGRDLAELDRVLLARDSRELPVAGFRNHHKRSGIGVPLVGVRERRALSSERFYPPAGLARPLTAVLRFDDGSPDSAVLTFHDPRRTSTLRIGSLPVPLAADFTAPYAYLVASPWLRALGRLGLAATEEALAHEGLVLLEPYDAAKTPVLMIHGLRSSPRAWIELTNDLWGDPQIRDGFQIWHYVYPSGLPYLYSASLLREELTAVREAVDPSGTDAALESMVIVAHSMGGLLGKTLVSESGRALWEEVAAVSPGDLEGAPRDVESLRRCFFFEPLPYVDRVIFLSTPHRGSSRADGLVGRLASALVKRPHRLKGSFERVAAANAEVIRPEMHKLLARGGATGVRALSPRYPVLQKLAALPIAPGVTVHTIVGDRGLARGKGARQSDGVVTYASAHLDEAASELVLPARHDVYNHPRAIAEVKRILREHGKTKSAGPANDTADSDARRSARLMARMAVEREFEAGSPRWPDAARAFDAWVERNPMDLRPRFREAFLYHYPRELLSIHADEAESAGLRRPLPRSQPRGDERSDSAAPW